MHQVTDFLIITALREELKAVQHMFPELERVLASEDDVRVYYKGQVNSKAGNYTIVSMPIFGMGRVKAANATKDAISHWKPRYIVLVGIAGGVAGKGIKLGDVLASSQVVDYELQKLRAEGPELRYEVHRADPRLYNEALALPDEEWQLKVASRRPAEGSPQLHYGPIATGDKVAAVSTFLQAQRQHWPQIIGIEMEAGGVASACFDSKPAPGFFMVRGVSDLADEDKDSLSVGAWREYACDIAAGFAAALIRSGPVPKSSSVPGVGREENTVAISYSNPCTSQYAEFIDDVMLQLDLAGFHLVDSPPDTPRSASLHPVIEYADGAADVALKLKRVIDSVMNRRGPLPGELAGEAKLSRGIHETPGIELSAWIFF
jgi:nucleoside phosphorylase